MVILQFNKLIRNKWVWGVFALIISAAFCFEDLFSVRDDAQTDNRGAGTLSGEEVDAKVFLDIAEEARGFGQRRDWKRNQGEVNLEAWQTYAALKVAEKEGICATDAEVQAQIRNDRTFHVNGAFNFMAYQMILRENGLTPERFEQFLKRSATLSRIGNAVLGSAAWASPMEVDRAVADMTDVFTVKVARFTQSKKDADAVKLDDAGLRKWYDDNTNSLALPERCKIRYVKYNANDKAILAKMTVTDDELRDYYDSTSEKYTVTDTNGVESVKKFEEVKTQVEMEVRKIAALTYFETNLNARAYSVKAAKGSSRLDEIAKEDGLKVEESDWFALDGSWHEGFVSRTAHILPGAKDFLSAVSELDSETEDLRYSIISSEDAVWLVEKSAVSKAHTPSFADAKNAIRPRALRAAKAKAFKDKVDALIGKGAKAVLASGNVSTNITFTVADLSNAEFPDQMAIARAAMKLKKGEVSEFTLTIPGNALVVVCEDRKEGDAAKAMVLRSQVENDVSMLQRRQIPESWRKWNLERMGFQPGEISSVETVKEEE
jgi:hypothetical protein